MKFKDVRTIESILTEYGMKPGSSTPTSQQSTGANAKANAKSPTVDKKTPPQKDLGSPTTTPGLDVKEPEQEQPKFTPIKTGELEVDAEYKDEKGEVLGKVVSKVGDKPQPDKVVVQDKKGEYQLLDPKDEVFVDLEENKKVKKLSQKNANKLSSLVKDGKKKIKRLARLGLKEAEEKLFEINFNRKEVINSSLDAQIRCGWEAETVWENIEGVDDDVDNMTLNQVDEEFGGVDWDSISEQYTEWLYDYKVDDYIEDAIAEWVNEREDDEDYINDYIDDSGIEEADWDDYREGVLRQEYGDERFEEEGAEELSELYGYEDENWAREYVDEYRGSDFREYLRELAVEDDDVRQNAYEEASENYDYDDWINDNWYSMSSFCDDYGIDYSTGNNLGEVAELVSAFVRNNSAFSDDYVEHGDYGNTSGSTKNYAVESDSSIDGYGTGAEIISPVFSTPRRMLAEMKKFFEFLQSEGALTNSSTGLHVTMSYNPQDGETVNYKPGSSKVIANKVKMAVLLGDQYLLGTFFRGSNTYTKSQYRELEDAVKTLQQEGGTEGIKKAEAFLEKAISQDKFRSIHFKNQTDSKTNTNLIEFRIGGGEDYEQDFDRVFKAVVRYATTMVAGHTDQYQGDYVKALSRLLRKASDISQGDVEEVENLKGQYSDVSADPLLDTSKAMISSRKYLEFTKLMLGAMEGLQRATDSLDPKADIKWKKQWMEYLENTSDNLEDFDSSLKRKLDSIKISKKGKVKEVSFDSDTEADVIGKVNRARSGRSIKAYFRPAMNPPSETAIELRGESLSKFSEALGMLAIDVSSGLARQQPNAKSIGALRSFIKRNEITEREIEFNVITAIESLVWDHRKTGSVKLNQQTKVQIVKDGINKLLQKDIIRKPDFVSAPEVEAIAKGMWNVANNKEFDSKVLKKLTQMAIDVRLGPDRLGDTADIESEISSLIKDASEKRQFNDFYNKLTTSGYSSKPLFLQTGMIFDRPSYTKLLQYVKQFDSYNEPVSRNHNPNIYSDDSYEDVALSNYTMLLRRRFSFLEQQYETDKSKAVETLQKMAPIIAKFYDTNKSDDDEWSNILGISRDEVRDLPNMSDEEKEEYMDLLGERDGDQFLGVRTYKYENIQGTLDDIVRNTTDSRTVHNINDYVTDTLREMLGSYYRNKERYPYYYKFDEIKNTIKSRFEGIRDFMRGLDKIFVDNGFDSQDDAIKRKQQLTKDRDNFKKNVRNRSFATINIPAHSLSFMDKELFDTIVNGNVDSRTQREVIEGAQRVNQQSRGVFYVVPSAHWGPLQDALEGMDQIQNRQKTGDMSQNWRLKNYVKLMDKFGDTYKIHYKTLRNEEKYEMLDGRDRNIIAESMQIEFTGKLDGRAGMGDVEELIPSKKLANEYSGEPLNRSSAVNWIIDEGNEAKALAAYDFKKYHGAEAQKIKSMVVQNMEKNNNGFYKAIREVMESTPKGVQAIADQKIIDAAGVEHMDGQASNSIQDAANWNNLANFLKIEKGVDNQGPNMLEKVARTFDGDHEWRPQPDPTVCCLPRWVATVKAAAEYIKMNYTVSGGNYFRKNPDGSPGDDVGAIYGDTGSQPPPSRRGRHDGENTTEADYEAVRSRYIEFDRMMNAGMQNYMVRPDVNRLVDFLKNPDNDETFKNAVLKSMMKEKLEGSPPNDFQGHLALGRQLMQRETLRRQNPDPQEARARMLGRESAFDKFDKLPLEEQVRIINESTVLEKWSKKYKASINCSNPKGFSQKAHCAGKKKKESKVNERPLTKDEKKDKEKYVKGMKKSKGDFEKRYGKDAKAVMYATATKMAKESVNDFNRIEIINKLLADHFPVGDLKKQMLAYQAIPLPSMLDAFRQLRADAGDDACARNILRFYVDALPEEEKKKVNLQEWSKQHITKLLNEYTDLSTEKDNIIKTISGLDATNEQHANLLDRIYKLLNSEHIGKTLDKAFSFPLMDEPLSDKQKAKVIQDVTKIIGSIDSDYGTMSKFIDRLEKTGTVVNIQELDKPLNTFANVFGDDISTKAFVSLTAYGVGVNQKGPGEYGLACLSNKIRLASGEGDLEIEGIGKVELKAATSSTGGRIGYGGGSQKAKRAIIEKYADRIPTVVDSIGSVGGSLGFSKFINGINQDLPTTDSDNQKIRRQLALDLFSMDMENYAGPIADVIANNTNAEEIENVYLKQNFLWYKDRDDFDGLLLISIPNQKTAMIKNENDLIAFRRSGHAMATSISIIPTQAGAGREQWAQLSLKKGTL